MFWKMLLKNYWRCQKRQAKSSVLGSEVILGMVESGRPRMAELVVSFYSYKKNQQWKWNPPRMFQTKTSMTTGTTCKRVEQLGPTPPWGASLSRH
jgi:hypothetical protein